MSEKPQIGPNIKRLAKHMQESVEGIDFIDHHGEPYERDYEADARWYVAYHTAIDWCETYKGKDWAVCVLDGMQPLSDQDVGEFCNYVPADGFPDDGFPGEPTKTEVIRWLHG